MGKSPFLLPEIDILFWEVRDVECKVVVHQLESINLHGVEFFGCKYTWKQAFESLEYRKNSDSDSDGEWVKFGM